jgi:hypothetical protein
LPRVAVLRVLLVRVCVSMVPTTAEVLARPWMVMVDDEDEREV